MKTAMLLMSFAVIILAVSGLPPFSFAKGDSAMPAKPLIDTRTPSAVRTATFAMG